MLNEIVGSAAKERILKSAIKFPKRSFTLTETSKKTGVSISRTKGILDDFLEAEILRKVGKTYKLNECFITDHLKKLLLPEEMLKELKKSIKQTFRRHKVSVVMYGSRVKNREKEDSDVDFLIICRDSEINQIRSIASLLADGLSDYFSSDAELLVIEQSEFKRLGSERDPFVVSVLAERDVLKDDLEAFR